MSVVYCHRGGHQIDLDYNCEGKEIGGEWVCWDCLTDEEVEEMEKEETPDQK